jgi:hypothetical protein
LLPGENLGAAGALVDFFGESFIDEFVGEINRVKAHGKIVDAGEIFVSAPVAQKIIFNTVHLLPPGMKSAFADFMKRPFGAFKKKCE